MPVSGRPGRLLGLALIATAVAACGQNGGVGTASPSPSSPALETTAPAETPPPSPYNPVYGVDLGIHVLSGKGPNDPVPDAEVERLLSALQGRTQWVRLYNVVAPWENVPRLAHRMGFKVAATAYLSGQRDSDERAINRIVEDVDDRYVDFALVSDGPCGPTHELLKMIVPPG